MISPEELQQSLKHFTSTDNYYRHLLSIRHTDGIQYLAQEAQCYWLIDVIASHQTKKLLADQMLKDFQLWLLVVGDPDFSPKSSNPYKIWIMGFHTASKINLVKNARNRFSIRII